MHEFTMLTGSQLLQSVQDTVQRLETQHPGVKVTLKMGNPTDRMHVQDELLSTAERNGSEFLGSGSCREINFCRLVG